MNACLARLRWLAALGAIGASVAACGARSTIDADDLPPLASAAKDGGADDATPDAADDVAVVDAPTQSACSACLNESCLPEQGACGLEQACVCWETCLVSSGGDRDACRGQCGQPSAATRAALRCGDQRCPKECTFGGPGGADGGGPPSTCLECLDQSCASQQKACAANDKCTCWEDCIGANGGNFQACFGQCGIPNGTTFAVIQCARQSCGAECTTGGIGGGGGPGGPGGGPGGPGGSSP